MAKVPASIRYKNPGAMWGNNPSAKRWGATNTITLNDGKGQGNNIAVFPTYVQGICAQIDLWTTSHHYKDQRFCDAIAIWSGHNSVESYIAFVLARVPGMTRTTVLDRDFWHSDMAVPFLKAQAWHEAGQKYPAPDADWLEALHRVVGTPKPVAPSLPAKPSTKPVSVPPHTGKSGLALLWAGLVSYFDHYRWELVGAGIALAVAYGVYRYVQSKHQTVETPTVAPTLPVVVVQSSLTPLPDAVQEGGNQNQVPTQTQQEGNHLEPEPQPESKQETPKEGQPSSEPVVLPEVSPTDTDQTKT